MKLKKLILVLIAVLLAAALMTGYSELIHKLFPGNTQDTVGELQVHFIDVGQGDSIYIKTPSKNILIDAGERGDTVVNYLKELDVSSLDLVISTHPHSDHIGGLVNVLRALEVKEVIDPGIVHTSKTFEDYLTLIDEKDIVFTEGWPGDVRDLGDSVMLEILHPREPKSNDLNNASVVARLSFGEISFLFTGDAEKKSEKEILDQGFDIKSTILKAGHHGSSTSTGEDFLNAVSPETVIIMCGEGNSYGHPHEEIIEMLESYDINIYRTDISGTIVIITDGKTYEVSTEK